MRVLVTGGSGNIGRVVSAELEESGHAVRVFDSEAPPSNSVEYCPGDVRDAASLDNALRGIDRVVHLAAIPAYTDTVPAASFMDVNVTGTFNLLEAAGAHGVSRVVFASSDSALGFVFGTRPFSPEYFPIDEAHPQRPQDPYGLSKLLGEELCKSATRKYGLETIALRFCWV